MVALQAVLLLTQLNTAQAQLSPEEVYKAVLPSVVTVVADLADGTKSQGTGFLAIADGCVVTAWHVVRGAKAVAVRFSGGEEFECSGIVDKDEKRDVAIVRAKVSGRPMLRLASGDPAVGSKAFIVGAPRGLEFSISDGLVSQIQVIEGVKQYQFSCPASQGNSGSPLLNASGEVSGVVSWQVREGQNLNFAIPIEYVRGLDASLPTTVWESVRSNPLATESEPGVLSVEEFCGRVFELRVQVNSEIEAGFDLETAITRVSADRVVIPASVFSAIDRIRDSAKRLGSLKTSDARLQLAAKEAAERYAQCADGLEDMKDATVFAMRDGWNNYTTSLLEKGRAKVWMSPPLPWDPVKEVLKASTPDSVRKRYPAEFGLIMLGSDAEIKRAFATTLGCGLRLYTRSFPRLFVAIVFPDSPAKAADVRPADEILTVDGKAVSGLLELESALAAKRGGKAKLRVRRLVGGEATVTMSVPR